MVVLRINLVYYSHMQKYINLLCASGKVSEYNKNDNSNNNNNYYYYYYYYYNYNNTEILRQKQRNKSICNLKPASYRG